MDQKFLSLEEAAEHLGISTDRLGKLREDNQLRGFRDGASWKFLTKDIEKMAADGVPEDTGTESGIDLNFGGLQFDDDDNDELTLDDLSLGDESEATPKHSLEIDAAPPVVDDDDDLELAMGSSAELSFDLDDDKPASAGTSDLELDLEASGDDADSILLSDAELGDSPDRPASTIIGKSELGLESDLDLLGDDDSGSDASQSDVRLAEIDEGGSDAGATGELPAVEAASVDFDNIEELELDLEAESSRILAPEDLEAAQKAAQAQQKAPAEPDSDLSLDDDFDLAGASDAGLTGLSGLEASSASKAGSELDLGLDSSAGSDPGLTGLSALELDDEDDDEDDFVLGDGSDITLSAADSGINLSPADSGISLDDAPSDLAGSAIGSGIDFGELSGADLVSDDDNQDFELTPMAEDVAAGEDDDSSQVIALDAFEEEQEADDLLGAGAGMGGAAVANAPAGLAATSAVPVQEAQFNGWHITFLSLCIVMLSLCGMMTVDLVNNIWSWDKPYAVNSWLMDSLNSFLGF